MTSQDILRKYRGQQKITATNFYDPDGDSVGLANVTCSGCLFSWGEKCAPLKERGHSEAQMRQMQSQVHQNRYCDFILSDFDDDDDAKREIRALNQKLFPR